MVPWLVAAGSGSEAALGRSSQANSHRSGLTGLPSGALEHELPAPDPHRKEDRNEEVRELPCRGLHARNGSVSLIHSKPRINVISLLLSDLTAAPRKTEDKDILTQI